MGRLFIADDSVVCFDCAGLFTDGHRFELVADGDYIVVCSNCDKKVVG